MFSNLYARTVLGLVAALCVLLAGCGNDDEGGLPLPTATAGAVSDTTNDGDQEPVADEVDHQEMEMGDDAGGHHEHATLMEVDYEPVPTIELKTHLDPSSGVNLEVITTGFTLAPQRASTEAIDGEGHFHIYVDGEKLRRLYAHWAHVDLKEPGDYEIRVEMSANNHATLAVDGEKLDATVIVTIPGVAGDPEPADGNDHHNEPSAPSATPGVEVPATEEPEATPSPPPTADATATIELEVEGGKPVNGVQRHRVDVGDMVTIVVNGDTADELHIHGYDLVLGFAPGQPGTITFEANIPGVFEVETHHHGDLVMELQVG